MSYPACPDASHHGSRVVRAGWYGKAPYRRQRWECVPANGDPPHRFAEPLPRQAAAHSHCSECSSALDPWEGQAGARGYLYTAREIAHALALVAAGDSYRRAAAKVRDRRRKAGWRVRGARGRRRGEVKGQLVANWVDVFGPVVAAELAPTRWPERLAVDATELPSAGGRSLFVFVAVGQDPPDYRSRVWLMRPYPTKDAGSWEQFFAELPGSPRRVVSDMDWAVPNAMKAAFPRPGEPMPNHHICELHITRAIERTLEPLPDPHPVRDALRGALHSAAGWQRYEQAVRHEHAAGGQLLTAVNWFGRVGPRVVRNIANRPDEGPWGVGAVEAVNVELAGRLDHRAPMLGNRARTETLLDLMAADLRLQVDEPSWAAKVRRFLEANGGRAPAQRPHDDRLGAVPSLYL